MLRRAFCVALLTQKLIHTGVSQLIVDGKIKIKIDSQIERFTETELQFNNGSTLPADAVIFSTG